MTDSRNSIGALLLTFVVGLATGCDRASSENASIAPGKLAAVAEPSFSGSHTTAEFTRSLLTAKRSEQNPRCIRVAIIAKGHFPLLFGDEMK